MAPESCALVALPAIGMVPALPVDYSTAAVV